MTEETNIQRKRRESNERKTELHNLLIQKQAEFKTAKDELDAASKRFNDAKEAMEKATKDYSTTSRNPVQSP